MQPLTHKRKDFLESIMIVATVLLLTLSGCGSETAMDNHSGQDSGSENTADLDLDSDDVSDTAADNSSSEDALENFAVLSWNSNVEPDLGGYKIYYGIASLNYDQWIDVGLTNTPNIPAFTLTNLQPGSRYYFAITAYDISGNESNLSIEAFKDIVL